MNFDPESPRTDAQQVNEDLVRQYLIQNPGEAKERWDCFCGGILHKHVSPLSMACALKANISIIMLLASSDPSSLEDKDNYGLTPLHFCVMFGSEVKTVRFLLQKSPSLLSVRDYAHQLPLHIALWKRASFEMVSFLLERHPESCKAALQDGRLPLHIACSNHASIECIDKLLGLYRQACQMPEKEGNWLPLHYACRNDASLQVIEALLHAFSQAATIPQANGWLPLHLACANQADASIINALLHICPEASMVADTKGNLALHICCKYQASKDVVERLIDVYPSGCKIATKDGSLPLHYLCSRQGSLEIIQVLVERYPRGLLRKNSKGLTPLDLSCNEQGKASFSDSKSSINEDSMALLSPASMERRAKKASLPLDRQISSDVLRNSLLSKTPKKAVPMSLIYLRKSTRKFSMSKNRMTSDNLSDKFRALDMRTCTGFVVQRFKSDVLLSNQEELINELEDLSRLNHPNLIRLLGYSLQETSSEPNFVVFELAEGGTLASLLSSKDTSTRTELDWRSRIRVAASIVSAIVYLSNQKRNHASIRPENICFWEGFRKVLLADYGNARLFRSQQLCDESIRSPYAAPEFLGGEVHYDENCQVFSIGFILKALITGQLPDEDEPPGMSSESLERDADPLAGDWNPRILRSFAALAESCMYDAERRSERPSLAALLEELLMLERTSVSKVDSAGQALGILLHVAQVNAEKEEELVLDTDMEMHSDNGNETHSSPLTRTDICRCSRRNVRGVYCCKEEDHFCCDKCFAELVNEQLGSSAVVCREAGCSVAYSQKEIYEHVEETLFYNHIAEAERLAFLEDLWGRGASRVLHVRQNQALAALNAMASRDNAPPEFPPLCVLCLVTSRRGGSCITNLFSKKRRFLLYFVCAFSKMPVKAAIKISRNRKWLRKAAPALKASMVALDICVSQTREEKMTHASVAKYMSMPVINNEINQFADESWESIVDSFSLFGQDPTGQSANERLVEARAVTKTAYEMLADLASSYPGT